MSNPKIIGIKFGDNDFGSTFRTLFDIIAKEGLESYRHLDKESFVALCNRALPGIYWIAQNKMRYQSGDPASYVQIKEEQVFFDDEVAKFLKDHHGCCDSDFFVLDTTVYGEPYFYMV